MIESMTRLFLSIAKASVLLAGLFSSLGDIEFACS